MPDRLTLKTIAIFILLLLATMAKAEECPDFYRFVDFGLVAGDGETYRGGPVFRAEDLDGQILLRGGLTTCQNITDVAKDGHGNPIPVVSGISFDTAKAGLDLTRLDVSLVGDVKGAALMPAQKHEIAMAGSDARVVRGADFLCEGLDGSVSCQVSSLMVQDVSLIAFCDADTCTLPVIALNPRIAASAVWHHARSLNDAAEIGAEISAKVRAIHAFLTPITSGL